MQRQWVLYAILALISYAGCNFLLGVIGKEASNPAAAGISATFVLWLVSGGCGLLTLAIQAVKQGALPGLGGVRNVIYAVSAGLVMAIAMLILTLALAVDPANAGPITAVLPLASLFVGFMAWALLGERVGLLQSAGIVIAFMGPVCMAIADTSSNALQGLLMGLVAALGIGANNFLLKVAAARGADDISVLIIMFLVHAVVGAGCVMGQFAFGEGLQSLENLKLVACATGSGVLFFFASLFILLALKGVAGPASATANASSVGVLVLDIIFYDPALHALKLVGMGLTIFGVTLLAVAPQPDNGKSCKSPPEVKAQMAKDGEDLEHSAAAVSGGEAEEVETKPEDVVVV